MESIQTEDEVKNLLVMIINLVINSWNGKATVRHLREAVERHEQYYNKIQWESSFPGEIDSNQENPQSG
jgi:hypothetical protein